MAAATETGREETVIGNKRCVSAHLAGDNTNTWDSGLSVINVLSLTCTTAAAYGATISGGVITLATGGALEFEVMVIGDE